MMKVNNCFIYALWRHFRNGDYIVIRRTRHKYWWPFCKHHYLVLPKNIGNICPYFESYHPDKEDLGKLPCPLFKGHITKGDKEI